MTQITPTIGRAVLYVPPADLGYGKVEQPFAATVAFVNPDGTVNLSAADHNGNQFSVQNVYLTYNHTAATAPDDHPGFCHWMEYQLKQAVSAVENVVGAGQVYAQKADAPAAPAVAVVVDPAPDQAAPVA